MDNNSSKHKEVFKTILKCGIWGLLVSALINFFYIVLAIFFNDSFVCKIFYNMTLFLEDIALFLGEPFSSFFWDQQITDSIFEGLIKLIISSLIGGSVIGIILGCVVKICSFIFMLLKNGVNSIRAHKDDNGPELREN